MLAQVRLNLSQDTGHDFAVFLGGHFFAALPVDEFQQPI